MDLATTAPPSTSPLPPMVPGSSSGLPFRATAAPKPEESAPGAADASSAPASSRASALPFRPVPAAASSAPVGPGPRTRLSLEQFASLAAEIAVAPSRIAEVRARYGLDEASHRREVEAYNQLFSAHQDLYRRFGALFQSYREWFAQAHR
jgi:hypothetical protein